MGNLLFLWRKETIFIYFTLITFAVYEREQNWPPQTAPHRFLSEIWAIAYSVQIIDSERKTLRVFLFDGQCKKFIYKKKTLESKLRRKYVLNLLLMNHNILLK